MGCGLSTLDQSDSESATPNRNLKLTGRQRIIRPVTSDRTSNMAKSSSKDDINGGRDDPGGDSQDKRNLSLSNNKQNSIKFVKERRSFRTKEGHPGKNDDLRHQLHDGMAQQEAQVIAMSAPEEKRIGDDGYKGQDQNEDTIHEMEMNKLNERQDQISRGDSPSFKEYCQQTHDSAGNPSFNEYILG